MNFKLTDRQREFAEQNHHILEDFLRYRHLPQEEFYDVVVFRFLRAVKQYDEREDLKAYSFKTVAKNHMRSALSGYFARKKREGTVLSLDYPLTDTLTLADVIPDKADMSEEICRKLSRRNYRLSHISPQPASIYKMAA